MKFISAGIPICFEFIAFINSIGILMHVPDSKWSFDGRNAGNICIRTANSIYNLILLAKNKSK